MSDKDESRQLPRDHTMNEIFDMLRRLLDEQVVIKTQHSDLAAKFRAHMGNEELHFATTNRELSRLADTVESLTVLHQAFPHTPDGVPDINGHRAFHDGRITESVERRKLWMGIKQSVVNEGVKLVMIGVMVIFALGAKEWIVRNISPEPVAQVIVVDQEGKVLQQEAVPKQGKAKVVK